MTVHIILLIYISLCGVVVYCFGISKKTNKTFLILALLGIFLVQALRKYTIGLDTVNYYFSFWLIKNERFGRVVGEWEPLYFYLNKFVGFFTDDAQWILVINSLIIVSGLGIFIYNNADERQSLFWHVFIFMTFRQYFNTMNLLRQCIAMAISCNVYTVLKMDKSWRGILKSVLLIIIAMNFHLSGIVAILIFVPFYIKMDRSKILLGLGGMAVLYLLYPYLFRAFIIVFPKYNRYDYTVVSVSNSYLLFGAINLLLAFYSLAAFSPGNPDNEECYRLLYFVVLSTVTIVLQRRNPLITRLGYYFEWFIILFIPEFIRRWRESSVSRVMSKYFVYLSGWLFYIYSMNVGAIGVSCVPYLFFWQ